MSNITITVVATVNYNNEFFFKISPNSPWGLGIILLTNIKVNYIQYIFLHITKIIKNNKNVIVPI